MHITMIGGGYVGLVSGACLAAFGTDVTIIEHDPARLDRLKAGTMPIYEPGLEELVTKQRQAGRLAFSDDLAAALRKSQAVFIAVGTPTRRGSGHADLSYVHAAARAIATHAPDGLLIVTKSTVPVGTGRQVASIVREARPELTLHIASNPEFLREGHAITDFMKPDRVIIGLEDWPDASSAARTLLEDLYAPLNGPESRLLFMGLESAELTKYAANAFLAMKVTFANEMADLCEATGGQITDVTRGMGMDPRIGPHFLTPGPGYGGSCFPKDTQALATSARQVGTPTQLVETIIAANEARKRRLAERILALAGDDITSCTIAVLGLTFKAHTDDMRQAPSLTILPLLHEAGATLRVHDPQGMDTARTLLPDGIIYAETPLQAAEGADMLLVLTEWPSFATLTPAHLASHMRGRLILDCRQIWQKEDWQDAGFDYHCLGMGRTRPHPCP